MKSAKQSRHCAVRIATRFGCAAESVKNWKLPSSTTGRESAAPHTGHARSASSSGEVAFPATESTRRQIGSAASGARSASERWLARIGSLLSSALAREDGERVSGVTVGGVERERPLQQRHGCRGVAAYRLEHAEAAPAPVAG